MLRQLSEKFDDPMAVSALIVFWMGNTGAFEKGSDMELQMDVSFLLKLTVSLAAFASLLPVPRLQLSSAPLPLPPLAPCATLLCVFFMQESFWVVFVVGGFSVMLGRGFVRLCIVLPCA